MQSVRLAFKTNQAMKQRALFGSQICLNQKVNTLNYDSKQSFANLNKKEVSLNKKWEGLASKELKGKDVKETLVRQTNEQMLVKPLYTQEDWSPQADNVEVPGKILCHEFALITTCRCVPLQERSLCYHVHTQALDCQIVRWFQYCRGIQ